MARISVPPPVPPRKWERLPPNWERLPPPPPRWKREPQSDAIQQARAALRESTRKARRQAAVAVLAMCAFVVLAFCAARLAHVLFFGGA